MVGRYRAARQERQGIPAWYDRLCCCSIGVHRRGHTNARPLEAIDQNPTAKAIVLTSATLTPGVAIVAGRKDPALGTAVTAYGALLTGHAAASAHLDAKKLPSSRQRARLVGSLLFLLSDALIGIRKFVLPSRPLALEGAVMGTYTAAQLLISESARATTTEQG